MRRMTRVSVIVMLVCGLASASTAQTLRESAAEAGTHAALTTQDGRTELNKPLWYIGAGVLGAGIGLVIGGLVNASDCNDLDGFGLIGALYEDECRDASTRRYLFGAAFASGGTALMLLARPRVAKAAPSVSFGPGRATINKTLTF